MKVGLKDYFRIRIGQQTSWCQLYHYFKVKISMKFQLFKVARLPYGLQWRENVNIRNCLPLPYVRLVYGNVLWRNYVAAAIWSFRTQDE
jgi:hypothetical protein